MDLQRKHVASAHSQQLGVHRWPRPLLTCSYHSATYTIGVPVRIEPQPLLFIAARSHRLNFLQSKSVGCLVGHKVALSLSPSSSPRAAKQKLEDRLAAAAREKLAQASKESKEKQLQAERKRKAALFLQRLRPLGEAEAHTQLEVSGREGRFTPT